MADVPEFLGTEFDIFARKPKQASTVETIETVYKTIAPIDQTDLEYLIPADNETYVDPNIKLYLSGRFVHLDGSALSATEYTTGTNSLLHTMFSQCTITLNGIQITQSAENYPSRALIETLLTYGSDAADPTSECLSGKRTQETWLEAISLNLPKRRIQGLSPGGIRRKRAIVFRCTDAFMPISVMCLCLSYLV
jgi:hypothetical protein